MSYFFIWYLCPATNPQSAPFPQSYVCFVLKIRFALSKDDAAIADMYQVIIFYPTTNTSIAKNRNIETPLIILQKSYIEKSL